MMAGGAEAKPLCSVRSGGAGAKDQRTLFSVRVRLS